MRASTSISERALSLPRLWRWATPLLALFLAGSAQAAPIPGAGRYYLLAQSAPPGGKVDRTMIPEEEDYSTTPYTEYGESSDDSDDEEEDTKFFRYSRFFGISLGLGYDTVTGNRGDLWRGGFPVVDIRLHAWLDFHFAISIGFMSAGHYYETTVQDRGRVDANLSRLGIDLRYYFDTLNLSAPISFANPYITIGAGSYTKTENAISLNSEASESSFGFSGGAGLEFTIKPKKTYFQVEGKVHVVNFKDTHTTVFKDNGGPDDLSGLFVTFIGSFLFTW